MGIDFPQGENGEGSELAISILSASTYIGPTPLPPPHPTPTPPPLHPTSGALSKKAVGCIHYIRKCAQRAVPMQHVPRSPSLRHSSVRRKWRLMGGPPSKRESASGQQRRSTDFACRQRRRMVLLRALERKQLLHSRRVSRSVTSETYSPIIASHCTQVNTLLMGIPPWRCKPAKNS